MGCKFAYIPGSKCCFECKEECEDRCMGMPKEYKECDYYKEGEYTCINED